MEGDEVSEAEKEEGKYGTQQKEGVKGHAGKIKKKSQNKKGVWKEKKQSQDSGTSSTNKGKGKKGNSGGGGGGGGNY